MRDVTRILGSVIVCAVAAAALVAGVSAARPTSAGNARAAERDTARLLGRVVLPGGAVRLSHEPRGDRGFLKSADSVPGGLLVDRHRFWLVPEPLARAISFVARHVPDGAKLSERGSSGGRNIPKNGSLTFSFPPIAGRIATRQLDVNLVALSRHRTGVRVDAQDIWMVPRPPAEKVPAAVRVIEVRSRKERHRVTGTRARSIARLFDALPIVQPGGRYGCPPDTRQRPTLSVRFLSANGVQLARAKVPGSFTSGACAPIEFWIRGRRQKPLSGRVYGRIERLLGVRFA